MFVAFFSISASFLMDGQLQWSRWAETETKERVSGGYEVCGRCLCRLSVGAVLVGGGGVGAVRLLAVFAWRHPLIYPVQAARFLEVPDLPRGRKALNG